jgi:hypothetical protein
MMFATGTVNPVTVTNDAWSKCYQNIRRANLFLANVDGAPITASVKNQYKAEARFLRAWYYFMLLRHYGGVPLIGDEVYEADSEMKTTRDTYADCVEYIVSECQAIINTSVLPLRRTGRENGRISEAACRGLIARTYLYAASKLYNGGGFGTPETQELLGYLTYDKERWKLALDAARNVISLDEYSMFEWHTDHNGDPDPGWGFYATFLAPEPGYFARNENTNEGLIFKNGSFCGLILEKKMPRDENGNGGNYKEGAYYPPSGGGNGNGGYAYKNLADAFPMIDGKPTGQSQYTLNPLTPNVNRDPRFKNTIIYDGATISVDDTYSTFAPVNIWRGTGSAVDAIYAATTTGFYIRKGCEVRAKGNSWNPFPHSHPLIRYSDILLMFVEAANEYYGPAYEETLGGTTIGCYPLLKAIRKRAGIEAGNDGMYGLKANMTQAEMSEAIRLERRIELAFEGQRFFDVRRWMIADQTDSQQMKGLEITRATDGTKTWREFVVRTHIWRQSMYFWPIPYSETVKSPDLLQNPYYE